MTVHGTCIALADPRDPDAKVGVLLIGPSGIGKSDLALRLIDDGADLVADDQVEMNPESDGLVARAPRKIAGLLEIRGVGVVKTPALEHASLVMVVEHADAPDQERVPESRFWRMLDVAIPLISTAFDAPSAPARVRAALRALRLGLFCEAAARLDDDKTRSGAE